MLSFDRVREVSDACASLSNEAADLLARIHRFLEHNSDQAIDWVPATKTFTATAATNVCAATAHGLLAGQKARVSSSGTLPAPLLADTDYWLVSVNANDFKLAATKGGSEIDITSTGTGTHTLHPVPDYITEEAAGSAGPGNLSGRTFTRANVSNAIGSLDNLRKLLTNQAATQGDHLGNLNQLAKPLG
jgi:hypothetical protein